MSNTMITSKVERARKDFVRSFYGWTGSVSVYENKVEINSKTCAIDEIDRIFISPSSFWSRGYLEILRRGESPASTIEAAMMKNDAVLLKAMGQNQEAEELKNCITRLQDEDINIKNQRLDIIKSKYEFGVPTGQGTALTKNGILYNIYDTVSTFEKWSIDDTQFILYEDIEFFALKGSLRQEMTLRGGGVNLEGALVGGLLFGGVGAVIGSQIGTDITSETETVDDRFIFIRSEKLPKDVILAIGEDVDDLLIDLRKAIPEKEYTSEGGFSHQENNTSKKTYSQELRELKDLFDDGIISQEEFDAKKKQLLGL